jgi:O-antigen/teichoic acid export membrane protein
MLRLSSTDLRYPLPQAPRVSDLTRPAYSVRMPAPLQNAKAGAQQKAPPRFTAAAIETFASQVAVAVLSFGNVLVIARTIGPEGRGIFAFLVVVSLFGAGIALAGMDEATINFAGRDPHLRPTLATNALILSLVLGLAVGGALAIIDAVFPGIGPGDEEWLRWLALALIPVLVVKFALKFLIAADYHFRTANISWILPPLANLIIYGVLAAAGKLTAASAFAVWGMTHLLATLLLVVFVMRRGAGFGRPSVEVARRVLGFGWKSQLGRMMMLGNLRLDQLLVGALAGASELGIYSVAAACSEVLAYVPAAVEIAQRPYLVRASGQEAGLRAARIFRVSVLITAALTVGLLALSPWLVPLLFGHEFTPAVSQVQILALGAFGMLALKQLCGALTAQQHPGLAATGAMAAFIVTVALDLILIPSHGGLGAAIASTAAYTTGGVVGIAIFLRYFKTPHFALVPRLRELRGGVRMRLDSSPAEVQDA